MVYDASDRPRLLLNMVSLDDSFRRDGNHSRGNGYIAPTVYDYRRVLSNRGQALQYMGGIRPFEVLKLVIMMFLTYFKLFCNMNKSSKYLIYLLKQPTNFQSLEVVFCCYYDVLVGYFSYLLGQDLVWFIKYHVKPLRIHVM